MSEKVGILGPGAVRRRPRAWWQWTLGFALLGVAIVSVVIRVVARVNPEAFATFTQVEPIPLKLPAGMKDAEVVPAAAGQFKDSNLLVVTLDTTRADRLHCYGNEGIDTTTLDTLAREGILFSKAIAPAPTTLPSHSTIMTGLYPYHHGARANGVFRLPEEPNETMAEVLSKAGYATGAVISAFVLDSRFGLARGFDNYNDKLKTDPDKEQMGDPERNAVEATDAALEWLGEHAGEEAPFFLWLHYFDVHQPYESPSPYRERHVDVPYDGELEYVDDQLARVIDFLEEKELRDDTLIVVIGDHGQGLGQHDELTHGLLLYDSTLHVPFIMNGGSRLGGGLHVARAVSSCDVMPTVLGMLGIDGPEACDGVDLTEPAESPDRLIFSDTLEGFIQHAFAPLMAVRSGRMKYVYGPQPELYDLAEDPYELNDLIAAKPDIAEVLDRRLREFHEEDLEKAGKAKPTEQLSDEDMQKLQALGYLSIGADAAEAHSGPLPNPKTMAKQVRIAENSFGLRHTDLDASIAGLEKLANEHPDFYTAHRWLAQVYVMGKRHAEAKVALERCEELHPNVPSTLSMLARAESLLGNRDAAIDLYRKTIDAHPDHFPAQLDLGKLLVAQGKPAQGIQHLRKACFIRPTDMEALELMAGVSRMVGTAKDDIEWMQKRVEKEPGNAAIASALGGLLMAAGRCEEVIPLLHDAIQRHPEILQLRNNLALALLGCGTEKGLPPLEAVVTIEKVCRETEFKVPDYLRTLAAAYAHVRRVDEAIAVAERAIALFQRQPFCPLAQLIDMNLKQYRKAQEEGVTPISSEDTIAPRPGAPPTTRPAS
jgi:arylsulfatase A-like enzyme/predicted Zn-dependent protease